MTISLSPMLRCGLSALALALLASAARAQTYTWNGGTDSTWSTASNWDSTFEPTATNDVLFPTPIPGTGATINLSAGEVANSLTFRDAYTLTGGDLTLATGRFTVAPTITATINSVLLGTNGLTLAASNGLAGGDAQAGGGTLILGGVNTFSGTVAIEAGILRFGNIAAINATNAANSITLGTAATTATLDYTGNTAAIARTVTLGSLAGSATGNTINVATSGQTLSMSGRILGGPAVTNTALTVTGPGILAFANNVSGTGGFGQENAFTGNVVVDGGSIAVVGLNGANTAGQVQEGTQLGGGVKSITLQNGGRFINNTTTFNPVGSTKSFVIGTAGGTIEANANITFDDAGQFSGTGVLTKTGAGTLTLGANAVGFGGATGYTGGQINLNAGTLTLNNEQAAGGGAGGTIAAIAMASGTVLQVKKDTTGVTFGNNITATGTVTVDSNRITTGSGQTLNLGTLGLTAVSGSNTLNVTGGNTYLLAFGATTLSGNTTFNPTTSSVTFASLDGGGATRTLTKTGAGFISATGAGANFGAGPTVINASAGAVFAGTATSFGPSVTVNVTNAFTEYVQSGGATAGSTYTFPTTGILGGNAAFLNSLTVGTNLNQIPDTIAQTSAGQIAGVTPAATAFLALLSNDARRFYAHAGNFSETLTVGTGTPWAGLGNDIVVSRVFSGTITANSDFTIRATNGVTFAMGAVTLTPASPRKATVTGGTVTFTSATANYNNNVTIEVANGATIQPTVSTAFGTSATPANNAAVNVLSGGAFNPNGGVSVNSVVTIQVGGILNIDDANNLAGTGSYVQFPGSITRITNNGSNALGGSMSPGTVAGSIVRMSTDNIANLGSGTAGATSPASNYVVNVAGTTVNGVGSLALLNANAVTLNSAGSVTVAGSTLPIPTGVLTNDGTSRVLTSNSATTASVITIGAGGGTIAASTGTTLTFRQNPTASSTAAISIAGGTNVLNFGIPAGSGTIDGQAKAGTVDIGGTQGSIVAGSVNILSGTLQGLGGGIAYTIGGGTGITRVFSGAVWDSRTGTLSNTTLQVDSGATGRFRSGGSTDNATSGAAVGGLSGAGNLFIGNNVTGTNRDVILTVGSNNASTTYSGVIADADGTRNGGIIKTGTGTLSLTAANIYTLATTVNLGTLALGAGGSLGATTVTVGSGATPTATAGNGTLQIIGNRTIGTATAGGLVVNGGNTGGTPIGQGTLSFIDNTINTLTLTDRTTNANTFTFGSNTAGNFSILNVEFGSTADRVLLGTGDTATIGTAGGNVVNITGLGGYNGGPIPIITSPGGGLATAAGLFTLGTVSGNTLGYTFSFTSDANNVYLTGTAPVGPAAAYWTGDQNGVWTTNNAGDTNFASEAAGTELGALPIPTTNVFFTANTAINLTTTLGGDTAVNSLTFTGTGTSAETGSVTISGNALTINATSANGNTAGVGIVVQAGSGAHTIASNIVLGTTQSWTNSSGSLLTISGNVDSGLAINTLTLGGTGNTTISGVVSGLGGLTKTGTGTATLSANNTYSGTTAINQGTLSLTGGAQTLGAVVVGTPAGTTTGTLDLSAMTGDLTIGSLLVQTNAAAANTIGIGAGRTLTATGAVVIGTSLASTTTTRMTFTGGPTATFTIGTVTTPTNANFQLGNSTQDSNSNAATLDLKGIGTFYANLGTGTFRVGDPTNGSGTATAASTLFLAPTSTIRAATITTDSPAGSNTGTHVQRIWLGTGANTFHTNTLQVGIATSANRSNGSLGFEPANTTGTLTVRDLAGTGRATMTVGFAPTATTGFTGSGLVDLNGHTADLLLSTLSIGGRAAGTTGTATGTFRYNAGTLDVTGVVVGSRGGGNTSGVSGTLEIGGGSTTIGTGGLAVAINSSTATSATALTGTVTLSGGTTSIGATGGISVTLGSAGLAGTTATAGLTISGAVVTVDGNIAEGTQTGTVNSTLVLSSGTLNMAGFNLGAAGVPINTLTFTGGTLTNLGAVFQNLTQASTAAASTLRVDGTFTTAVTGAYAVSGGANAATATVNGTLTATTGVTVGGTGPATLSGGGAVGNGTTATPVTIGVNGTLSPGGTAGNTTAFTPGAAGSLTLTNGASTATGATLRFSLFDGSTQDGTNAGLSTNAATLGTQTTNTGFKLTNGTIAGLSSTSVLTIAVDATGATGFTAGQYSFLVAQAPGQDFSTLNLTSTEASGTATFQPTGFGLIVDPASFSLTGAANGNVYLNFTAAVPEPTTVLGLVAAGFSLASLVRRRRHAKA